MSEFKIIQARVTHFSMSSDRDALSLNPSSVQFKITDLNYIFC